MPSPDDRAAQAELAAAAQTIQDVLAGLGRYDCDFCARPLRGDHYSQASVGKGKSEMVFCSQSCARERLYGESGGEGD